MNRTRGGDGAMPDSQDEFATLMRRLEEGSADAARELFERYGPHIRRVVRRKLHQKLRSKFDSLDFVQDVWASFFAATDRPRRFEQPEALIAFLARVAHNKVVATFRQRFQTDKYNVNRERSLDSAVVGPTDLAAREPSPSQLAVAHEQWDRLLKGQPLHYQRILILLRQGKTHQEIARELDLNEKTVRRVIQKLNPGARP
jgi:RNA polymerase sigma-70 factor (ECF subfamily)